MVATNQQEVSGYVDGSVVWIACVVLIPGSFVAQSRCGMRSIVLLTLSCNDIKLTFIEQCGVGLAVRLSSLAVLF